MHYGYARVSVGSPDKNTIPNQRLILRDAYGIADPLIFADIASGGDFRKRPGLVELLELVTSGDTVYVIALDRLGRSLFEVVSIIEDLYKREVGLVSERERFAFDTPLGRAMMQITLAFAEMERGLIRERTRAGLARAVANGKHLGRKLSYSKEKARLAQTMRAGGSTMTQIQEALGLTRNTLRSVLRLDIEAVNPGAWV